MQICQHLLLVSRVAVGEVDVPIALAESVVPLAERVVVARLREDVLSAKGGRKPPLTPCLFN